MTRKEISEINRLWSINVRFCRQILQDRKKDRLFIAEKALEVCEISWGGNQKDRYTVKQFAKEIGVSPKTLGNWISVKIAVYDKLTVKNKNRANFAKMIKVARKVDRKTPKVEVNKEFEYVDLAGDNERKALEYLYKMRSFFGFLEDKGALMELSEPLLQEILFISEKITSCVKSENPKLKAKDNRLFSKYKVSTQRLSVNAALGRTRITGNFLVGDDKICIKNKEQEIYDFLLDESAWKSPTQIGTIVGKKNKNAASAWSCRSLEKLLSLGLVKRNSRGHYLAVDKK